MRIALDARTIYHPQRRGTGRNLIDLYRHVAQLRPDWQILAFHRQRNPDRVHPWADVRRIEMPGDRWNAWERYRLPFEAMRHGAAVLHCPANTCPAWMPTPTVVTIHDLIPLDSPTSAASPHGRRFEAGVRQACATAAAIICPSQFTATRLEREFGADPERITVNYWAPDTSMAAPHPERQVAMLRTYNVSRRFVLHFGAADPRKNTQRVIEAWAATAASARGDRQLLIVGLDPATIARHTPVIESMGVQSSVVLHGFADENDLPTLLTAADALLYPSLSEGFGLPLLDAWVCRTPVITSTTTSLPEIAGDAAMLVEPDNTASIARALSNLLRDSTLRQELVSRGERRVKDFTWEASAQRFIAAMERAVQDGARRAKAA